MPTLFERIIAREIPAEIVFEDELAIAIRDVRPQAKVHVLVIPKKPIPSLQEVSDEDNLLMGHLMSIIRRVAEQEGIAESGYRVVVNFGNDALQTVPHLHFHLLGGRTLSWPPG